MEDGKEEASGGGGEEAGRQHERAPRPGVASALKEPRESHSPAAILPSSPPLAGLRPRRAPLLDVTRKVPAPAPSTELREGRTEKRAERCGALAGNIS